MANQKKVQEGLEHVKNAEKCMKTGLFKWKPDLDGAVSEYTKAAIAFKTAKSTDHAINTYLKCSQVQREMGSPFHAAKSLEAAALILRDVNNHDKAADFVEQAADLYLEHGTPDTAAIALDRAGKMIEEKAPERAIKLYMRACDVSEGEDRPRQCAEMVGKAGRVLLRLRRMEEAAAALKREMDYFDQVENHGIINKLVMGLVMIHLYRQDVVAADVAYRAALDYTGFAECEEAGPIEQLLAAYDQGDTDAANQILCEPQFKHMENEFTKLARDLRAANGPSSGSHSQGGSTNTTKQDDYSEGLL